MIKKIIMISSTHRINRINIQFPISPLIKKKKLDRRTEVWIETTI